MHTAPFTLALTVWVPAGTSWAQCTILGASMTEELIKTCGELRAVLGAQGRLVSRILSSGPKRPDAFRINGRRTDCGELTAQVEWRRSAETHLLVPACEVWTSCEWVHPATLSLTA